MEEVREITCCIKKPKRKRKCTVPRYLSASTSIMLWVCYLQLCTLSPKLPGAPAPHRHISLAFPRFYSGTVGLMALQLQTLVLCLCRVSWEAAATGVRNTPTHFPSPFISPFADFSLYQEKLHTLYNKAGYSHLSIWLTLFRNTCAWRLKIWSIKNTDASVACSKSANSMTSRNPSKQFELNPMEIYSTGEKHGETRWKTVRDNRLKSMGDWKIWNLAKVLRWGGRWCKQGQVLSIMSIEVEELVKTSKDAEKWLQLWVIWLTRKYSFVVIYSGIGELESS